MKTTIKDGKTYTHIDNLQNWEKNPRGITEVDFKRLKESIKKRGQFKPSVVTTDGVVLGGNMRLRAYKELGITEVWISIVNAPDDKTKLEYALADNDRAGYYEEDKLAELVISVPELNLEEFKVDLGKLTTLTDLTERFGPDGEEDEPPEVSDEEPDSKPGEVYQLGPHRLMCGDATKIEDVEKLMNGQKADMIFTDPPYNVDYVGKTKDALKIQNDKFEGDGFYQFLLDAFSNISAVSKSGAAMYVCHADSEGLNFRKSFIDAGFLLKQCIVWNKNSMVMGRQDYQWKHEPILYGWKDGGSHRWFGDRSQTTVWDIDRPTRSEEHPTMKPIKLIERALKNSSKSEDIILDTFGGSGSTLIASEQNKRICYTMELDPRYCDVIRKRYYNLIGKEDQWQEKERSQGQSPS